MPSAAAEAAPIVDWSGDGYRLIPSRFPPVSIYAGLVADDRIAALARVEDLTNPRLQAERRIVDASGAPAGSAKLQNWNLAPFAYGNPEGSVFFGPERRCLELSDFPQTALAVSVTRRETFLRRTAERSTGLDMRMLKTPIVGRFVDLRACDPGADPAERRRLGEGIPADVDGILFRPRERPSGTGVAVLAGRALGRSIQTTHYRFLWDGIRVVSLYAFDEVGRVLRPEELTGDVDVLAA